ncbi:MAG: sigma-70 family RNA polymerase sigma factor [Candidatus Diapherotrites archaeon]|nr:sigma-70 family RNA polymerase sigma factor [Candidatus Diapherotrites archaeon]
MRKKQAMNLERIPRSKLARKQIDFYHRVIRENIGIIRSTAKKFAWTLPDQDEIIDLIKFKLFTSASRLDASKNTRGFVSVVARNVCLDLYRKMRKRKEVQLLDLVEEVERKLFARKGSETPLDIASRKDLTARIIREISTLPPSERGLIEYIFGLGHFKVPHTYQQAADFFKIPLGTIKSKLFSAKSKLKSKLEKYA